MKVRITCDAVKKCTRQDVVQNEPHFVKDLGMWVQKEIQDDKRVL